MFLRTKIVESTPLIQLVESDRNAEGQPRQRVVASLGDVDIPEPDRKAIPAPPRTILSTPTQDQFTAALDAAGRGKAMI